MSETEGPVDAGNNEGNSQAQEGAKRPPQQKRPKMTLEEQSIFLSWLISRCVMRGGEHKGLLAGHTLLSLTKDEVLKLQTIQQTIAIFDMEGAAELVRREIWRKRQNRGGRG